MTTFILTWNPAKWTPLSEEINDAIEMTRNGEPSEGQWSVGSRRGGAYAGDGAYLLRQGTDRGIVAAGTLTSEVFETPHWDGSGRPAYSVSVSWQSWLDTDERLPTETLLDEIAATHWNNMQGSGVALADEDADTLSALWGAHLAEQGLSPYESPDEVAITYAEGATKQVIVNRYERDPRARQAAIDHHGVLCMICGFDFAAIYGEDLGGGYTHVHHVRELSTLPEGYEVDPTTDLIPVCPNCHAMLHRQTPAMSPDDLHARLRRRRR